MANSTSALASEPSDAVAGVGIHFEQFFAPIVIRGTVLLIGAAVKNGSPNDTQPDYIPYRRRAVRGSSTRSDRHCASANGRAKQTL